MMVLTGGHHMSLELKLVICCQLSLKYSLVLGRLGNPNRSKLSLLDRKAKLIDRLNIVILASFHFIRL